MNASESHTSDGIDERLDTLLQEWAGQYRLSPAQAESVRRAAVQPDLTTMPLPPGWWQHFQVRFQTMIGRAITLANTVPNIVNSDSVQRASSGHPPLGALRFDEESNYPWFDAESVSLAEYRPYVKLVASGKVTG